MDNVEKFYCNYALNNIVPSRTKEINIEKNIYMICMSQSWSKQLLWQTIVNVQIAFSFFKGTLTSLTLFISQIDTEILRITVKKLFPNSSYILRKFQKTVSLQWPKDSKSVASDSESLGCQALGIRFHAVESLILARNALFIAMVYFES